jgi:hypothetical protein
MAGRRQASARKGGVMMDTTKGVPPTETPAKFGPWELSQAVNAFLAEAKKRYEDENPHLELKINWSWSSKLRKQPKAKKKTDGGLFGEVA